MWILCRESVLTNPNLLTNPNNRPPFTFPAPGGSLTSHFTRSCPITSDLYQLHYVYVGPINTTWVDRTWRVVYICSVGSIIISRRAARLLTYVAKSLLLPTSYRGFNGQKRGLFMDQRGPCGLKPMHVESWICLVEVLSPGRLLWHYQCGYWRHAHMIL